MPKSLAQRDEHGTNEAEVWLHPHDVHVVLQARLPVEPAIEALIPCAARIERARAYKDQRRARIAESHLWPATGHGKALAGARRPAHRLLGRAAVQVLESLMTENFDELGRLAHAGDAT